MEEVRSETGENGGSGRDLIQSFAFPAAVPADRQIEVRGLVDLGRILAVFFITAHHVTMQAAARTGITPVPPIPCDRLRRTPVFRFQK